MKKFLSVIFTALSILVVLTNTSFAAKWGKGELKLAPWAVDYFIKYIRGKHSEAPGEFVIAKDSSYAMYIYCSAGAGNCRDAGMLKEIIEICEKEATSECYRFARGRTVKWMNGINKGTKESKIYTKWSDSEIRAKLTELGFLGEATSTEGKVSTTNKGNTVEQLETLSKLYESGNLTKEEFDAAKKKVLND